MVSVPDAIDAPVGETRANPVRKSVNGITVEITANNTDGIHNCLAVMKFDVLIGFTANSQNNPARE